MSFMFFFTILVDFYQKLFNFCRKKKTPQINNSNEDDFNIKNIQVITHNDKKDLKYSHTENNLSFIINDQSLSSNNGISSSDSNDASSSHSKKY